LDKAQMEDPMNKAKALAPTYRTEFLIPLNPASFATGPKRSPALGARAVLGYTRSHDQASASARRPAGRRVSRARRLLLVHARGQPPIVLARVRGGLQPCALQARARFADPGARSVRFCLVSER